MFQVSTAHKTSGRPRSPHTIVQLVQLCRLDIKGTFRESCAQAEGDEGKVGVMGEAASRTTEGQRLEMVDFAPAATRYIGVDPQVWPGGQCAPSLLVLIQRRA